MIHTEKIIQLSIFFSVQDKNNNGQKKKKKDKLNKIKPPQINYN